MNRLSGVFQFLLGFFLGIFLLVGGTASLAYVVFSRMNANPEKPMFAEEKPPETTATTETSSDTKTQPVAEVVAKESVIEEEREDLPNGAYRAKVTWSTGLSLRSQPASDAERIGGVEYNTELIILKTSADGGWQQVRLPGSQREGWVKAGNVAKIDQ